VVDWIVSTGAVSLASLVGAAAGGAEGHVHDHGGGAGWWIGQISAVVLLLVMARALWWKPTATAGESEDEMTATSETVDLEVQGMNCNHCVQSVTRALSGCAGVERVEVELEPGSARIVGDGLATEELLKAVDSLGFKAAVV
jgi:copper chaperone CopZ